jgi:hypothetical protein
MRRALWEFDSENEDRIDVPALNITGTFADISKLTGASAEIGDTVTVLDNGNEIPERVIKTEYNPYRNDSGTISIGRMKRDLFFYLDQMGTLARRYGKISTTTGKVKAQSIAGTISNSGIKMTSSTGELSLLSDMIKISDGAIVKTQIGNQDGRFVFTVRDNDGNCAIEIGSDGRMKFTGNLTAQRVSIGENELSINEDGELCVNGNKILTQE